jgi:dihydroorotase
MPVVESGAVGDRAILLRGGRVIDPAAGIDGAFDVLVRDGRVAEVRPAGAFGASASAAPVGPDLDVRDVSGCVVTPGLIDLHGHWYEGSAYGIDPAYALRGAVTTAVDAGTAGFVNFASFRRQSIDGASLRVLAFVNVAAVGIPTTLTGELEQPAHLRPIETAAVIRANRDVAVGVKVRLSAAPSSRDAAAALDLGLAAARAANVPLMVDIGSGTDFMPTALDRFAAGDILTHCFTGGGATIIDAAGHVRPEATAARARGVRFDIGHGCGSFSWGSARAALAEGFLPDSISSDLHRFSVGSIGVELPTMIAKFLALGLTLPEVIARVTVAPAAEIGLPAPSLAAGAVADVSVLRVVDGPVALHDAFGETVTGAQRLEPVLALVGGRLVESGSVSVALRPLVEADRGVECGGITVIDRLD